MTSDHDRETWPKRCAMCGRVYRDRYEWGQLAPKGITFDLDWRDCPCGNTLAIPA